MVSEREVASTHVVHACRAVELNCVVEGSQRGLSERGSVGVVERDSAEGVGGSGVKTEDRIGNTSTLRGVGLEIPRAITETLII